MIKALACNKQPSNSTHFTKNFTTILFYWIRLNLIGFAFLNKACGVQIDIYNAGFENNGMSKDLH